MQTSGKILIRAAAESNVGNARGNNEDNVYFNGDYITPRNIGRPFAIKTGEYTDVNVFAVFDGMGRNKTGSFASLVAATKLDAVTDRIAFDTDVTPDDAALREASCQAGRWSVEKPSWQGTEGGHRPKASEELRASVQQPVSIRILPIATE